MDEFEREEAGVAFPKKLVGESIKMKRIGINNSNRQVFRQLSLRGDKHSLHRHGTCLLGLVKKVIRKNMKPKIFHKRSKLNAAVQSFPAKARIDFCPGRCLKFVRSSTTPLTTVL